jgi:hypothetical protein
VQTKASSYTELYRLVKSAYNISAKYGKLDQFKRELAAIERSQSNRPNCIAILRELKTSIKM